MFKRLELHINSLLQIIFSFFYKRLLQTKNLDGRFVTFLLIMVYFGTIYFSHFFMPYDLFWRKLGVPTLLPSFIDMREVLGGFDCTRLGYDVLFHDPCGIAGGGDQFGKGDPNLNMPYPRAWWMFTFLGLSQTHTVFVGVSLALAFYAVLFLFLGKISQLEGLAYGIILCSPPIMLLVERGNVDMVLFVLVAIVLLTQNRFANLLQSIFLYTTLFLVTSLKLFPVFGFISVLRERPKIFIIFSIVILSALSLYLFSKAEEINHIQNYFSANHEREKHSYGFKVIGICLVKFFSNPRLATSFKFKFLFILWFPIIAIYLATMFVFLKSMFANGLRELINTVPNSENAGFKMDGFRIGAGIYLGTFLVGWNYDYKLCFWLLTLPQLFLWIRQGGVLARHSALSIVLIIFSLYCSIATLSTGGLDELANWYLFGFYLVALLVSLPNWMMKSLKSIELK